LEASRAQFPLRHKNGASAGQRRVGHKRVSETHVPSQQRAPKVHNEVNEDNNEESKMFGQSSILATQRVFAVDAGQRIGLLASEHLDNEQE
jgi:hypothetical protein